MSLLEKGDVQNPTQGEHWGLVRWCNYILLCFIFLFYFVHDYRTSLL